MGARHAVYALVAAAIAGVVTPAAKASVRATNPSRCTLAHSGSLPSAAVQPGDLYDGEGRDRTCVETSLKLVKSGSSSAVPKVGETGSLTLTIRADAAEGSGNAAVIILLGRGLTSLTPPRGFRAVAVGDPFFGGINSRVKGDGSHTTSLWGSTTLAANTTIRITFPVRVQSSASGTIEAYVGDANDSLAGSTRDPVPTVSNAGGQAVLPFTIGVTSSKLSLDKPQVLSSRTADPAAATAAERAKWPTGKIRGQNVCPGDSSPQANGFCPGNFALKPPVQIVPPPQLPNLRARAAGVACAEGDLLYLDQTGRAHPSVNVPVEAIDVNPLVDSSIGSSITGWDGHFRVCFDNAERGLWPGSTGTADVKLRFTLDNEAFRVESTSGGTYNIDTGRKNDVGTGTINWGTVTGPDSHQRGMHAFDEMNKAWAWANASTPGLPGYCWDESDCGKKTIIWEPDAKLWPIYRRGGGVMLPGNGPDWESMVFHELGHHLMYDVYHADAPSRSCPSPHYFWENEEAGCAWVEGFASWFSMAITGTPDTMGYGGAKSPSDLKPLPWSAPPPATDLPSWQTYPVLGRGSNVEARIAHSMWDLGDSENEAPWDRESLGQYAIWDSVRHRRPVTFAGLLGALSVDTVDTGSLDFRATLYGNTIDLQSKPLREPLTESTWVDRPMPPSSPPALDKLTGLGTRIPADTSNGHAYLWDRSGSGWCTDTVEVQNLGDWASGYLVEGGNPKLPVDHYWSRNFRITAFPTESVDLASSLATSSTGSKSLFEAGSLVLPLPREPRRIWIQTNADRFSSDKASAPSASPMGSMWFPMTNVYKLRVNRCSLASLGSPKVITGISRAYMGLDLVAGKSTSVTVTPSSRTARGEVNSVSASVAFGSNCNLQGENADCSIGQPIASATGRSTPGRSITLRFTPARSGLYQLDLNALVGPGDITMIAAQQG